MRTDEQLYLQLRQGDPKAFDQLYLRYEKRLFGFLLGLLSRREDAEEVFHEVFKAVLTQARAPASDEQPRQFTAWLFALARHRALNLRRQQKSAASLASTYRQAHTGSANLDAELCTEERSQAVAKAVAALPDGLAAVYQLRRHGDSYEEIATKLRIPIGTVRSRLHHLTQRLRKDLQLWIVR